MEPQKVELKGLATFVQSVLVRLPLNKTSATILALSGNLGAGKTTFVQALAREVGVKHIVQSPTYVLMKLYPISYKHFTMLVHIDAYRLNSASEFAALNPASFLDNPNVLVCIEWPEKVEGALPKPDLVLNFSSEAAGEGERYIHLN